MLSINEKGMSYSAMPIPQNNHFEGTLSSAGQNLLEKITGGINEISGQDIYQELAKHMVVIFDKFLRIQYCSKKLSDHISYLYKPIPEIIFNKTGHRVKDNSFPQRLEVNPFEIVVEYESLIFHCSSALDALSNKVSMLCKDCYDLNGKGKKKEIHFSNILKALERSKNKDNRARIIYDTIVGSLDPLFDLVISDEKKTLRNYLAHETTVVNFTNSMFVIASPEEGVTLRFDQDVYGLPLVGSARKLISAVNYILIETISTFLSSTSIALIRPDMSNLWRFDKSYLEPIWSNKFINWREYLSDNINHPSFTVSLASRNGISLREVRLHPSVLERASSQ